MEEGKHILLVDDESSFRFSIGVVLRMAGFRLCEAGDGHEALRRFHDARIRETPVDLVLTDVRMPGMAGIELIDEIRRHEPGVPIVVVTCCNEPCDAEELRIRGCRDAIAKPFDPTELVRLVRRVLEDSAEVVS